MKMLGAIFIFSLSMNSVWAGCFDKQHQPTVVVAPFQVVTPQPVVVQPVVVQTTRLVPVVETRLEYRPVASYYLNYSYYYVQPRYEYRYVADPWQGYNY